MRFLYWLIALPIGLAVLVFAVVNRHETVIDLWPFPYSMTVPVFAVAIACVFVGFLWGGVVAWAGAGQARHRAREYARRYDAQQRELAALRGKVEAADAARKSAMVALPPAPSSAGSAGQVAA